MAQTRKKPEKYTHYHKDGSVWAKGQTVDGVPVYKVTKMKPPRDGAGSKAPKGRRAPKKKRSK